MPEAGSNVNTLVGLIIVIVLVLLNGFFVAAEFALVTLRKSRIEELIGQGVRAAETVRRAARHPDQLIAATQLGITLASLGVGWIGEPAIADAIAPLIKSLPIPSSWQATTAHTIAVVIAFSLITFFHVVIGELSPKSIALQRPESVALIVAPIMIGVEVLFRPGVWILSSAANFILSLMGFEPATGHESAHSVDEIKMLVEHSTTSGLIEENEQEMFDAVFALRLMNVRQIMIPRTEMFTIPSGVSLRQLLALQKDAPYTKIPVFEKDKDHIIGILYIRDIVDEIAKGNLDSPILPFIRPGIFLPESTRITGALTAFREGRQHLAIVLDEYGGTAGMVTLEDILEEISGEIPDQFEEDEQEIRQLPDGSWLIDGLTSIEDVNEELDIDLSDENYDTIGGYVMGRLERIPEKGDQIAVDGLKFCVEQVDGMRIDQLRIVLFEKGSGPEPQLED